MIQNVFRRYEIKYLITLEQKERILEVIKKTMQMDQYGHSVIRNLYYDTDTFRLIRHSLERPVYKEKLRIRSYRECQSDTIVFVELKKKFDSIVYKRRIEMEYQNALDWLAGSIKKTDHQIANEIDYFLNYYETLHPVVFLSYERDAYVSVDDDFRVTFDQNILYRTTHLTLESEVSGTPLLQKDQVLMEVKCTKGMPLWMSEILSKEKIYKTSFSKYGKAYEMMQEDQSNGNSFSRDF